MENTDGFKEQAGEGVDGGNEEEDKVTELRSSAGGDDDRSPEALKRNSLMVDDFPDFDPESLEVEDDWRDVFDDDEDSGELILPPVPEASDSTDATATGTGDNDIEKFSDGKSENKSSAAELMPPPPPLTENNSSKGSTASRTMSSMLPTSFADIPGIDSKNRPPMDHSITRRKKTAGTADRRDSAPPSWHSEAADLPHRQAMVQDIAKLLYARKKGKSPSRSWLERVPLKAKTLESQLYKNAASLEAYLNRATLKGRLGKLASAITTHYKEASHSRRSSTRSSASSISSLASLENALADARLRRESSSSIQSMPGQMSISEGNKMSSGNDNAASNASGTGGLFGADVRRQSDSILNSTGNNKKSSLASLSGNSASNNNTNMISQKANNPNLATGGSGIMNASNTANDGMTQQLFLASIRQQQQELTRRLSGGNSNSGMMNTPASVTNPAMGMMGGANLAMMNQQALLQQQQQQQQLNLLQQQQQLQVLQQQQAMAPSGLSLHNISIMQQQQQRQMQQNQMMGLGGVTNNNAMGLNMMNANSNVVIPGVAAIPNHSMQALMSNQMAMAGSAGGINNSMMDMRNMPPPGMANASSMNALNRRSSGGNNPSGNDDPAGPLSPGSFNW